MYGHVLQVDESLGMEGVFHFAAMSGGISRGYISGGFGCILL